MTRGSFIDREQYGERLVAAVAAAGGDRGWVTTRAVCEEWSRQVFGVGIPSREMGPRLRGAAVRGEIMQLKDSSGGSLWRCHFSPRQEPGA